MNTSDAKDFSKKHWLRACFCAFLIAALLLIWSLIPIGEWSQATRIYIGDLGVFGPIAFALIYIVAVVTLAPASPLSIAAGILFGLWGLPLVIFSATVGATLAFIASRYIARNLVASWVEGNPRFKALDQAVGQDGWKIVGLFRLSPLVPFNLQNYFFGITNVPFVQYVLATLIGIIPGSFLYVYLGTLGTLVSEDLGWLNIGLLGIGLIASISLVVFVSIKAKRMLEEIDASRSCGVKTAASKLNQT